jgi:hypothetical protein
MPREQSVPASIEQPKPASSAPASKTPPTNGRTIETDSKNPF